MTTRADEPGIFRPRAAPVAVLIAFVLGGCGGPANGSPPDGRTLQPTGEPQDLEVGAWVGRPPLPGWFDGPGWSEAPGWFDGPGWFERPG
jgi:hypothetical protein